MKEIKTFKEFRRRWVMNPSKEMIIESEIIKAYERYKLTHTNKAKEILEQMPDIKIGIDSFYGKQTVLNALNEALNTHSIIEQSERFICDAQEKGGMARCHH